MTLSRAAALAAIVLAALVVPRAHAGELVVVEARGVAFHPGDVLDDQKTLALKEGQHITLIAANGATVKLDGPYDKAPATGEGGETGDIGLALRALVTQSVARAEAGVTRTGVARVVLPEPWLVDVSRSGIVCLRTDDKAVLWRENAGNDASLAIVAGDRTWRADAAWAAGEDRVTVPADMPMHGGTTYLVRLDGREAAVTVKLVPKSLANGEMQAAWLADVGCGPQAEALYKTLHP